MTDDSDYSGMPTGRIAQLRYSITNLWDDLGTADDPKLGLFVSVLLALVGVFVYVNFSGWVGYAGAFWAILNVLGPVKWVLGL